MGERFSLFGSHLAQIRERYWPLIKSRQTALLLLTGVTGYLSARCPIIHFDTVLGLSVSLFLAISGSTIINMWFDRDVDACMPRTRLRPLPAGRVSPREALLLGSGFIITGLALAYWMDPLYGLIVFLGVLFDVAIYTMWLKRRTAWAILWGGISGGMPGLAGRVLGMGALDWVGMALALGILFWIPMHIMTISIKHDREYRLAGIPTFPSVYGQDLTRRVIAGANLISTLALAAFAFGAGISWGFFRLIMLLSVILFVMAVVGAIKPTGRLNFRLFKFASVYLATVLVLVTIAVM